MEESYKGVKGGDPARRPPQFLAEYTCKHCGKKTERLSDFGRPHTYVCQECRDIREGRQQCRYCRSYRGTVELIWFNDHPLTRLDTYDDDAYDGCVYAHDYCYRENEKDSFH